MSKQYEWLKKRWPELRRQFGGVCYICGSDQQLEFAHQEPTKVSGRGRGSFQRYYDILMNIGSYTLLCRKCHKEWK